MIQAKNLVHAGVLNSTNEQNHATNLSNVWTMSKGQLIRQMEMMQMEINRFQNQEIVLRETISEKNKKISYYQDRYLEKLDEGNKSDDADVKYLRVAM